MAHTSKEGILPTHSLQITSKGISSSGPVVVRGERGESGKFESLVVEAFGKKVSVAQELLDKIPSQSNGIQLSFENSIRQEIGKVVYVGFQFGFTSGPKKLVTLSVREDGSSQLVD